MSGTIASTILSYVIVGSIGFYRALVVVHGTIGLVREGIRFSYRSVFIAYLSQFCAPHVPPCDPHVPQNKSLPEKRADEKGTKYAI